MPKARTKLLCGAHEKCHAHNRICTKIAEIRSRASAMDFNSLGGHQSAIVRLSDDVISMLDMKPEELL